MTTDRDGDGYSLEEGDCADDHATIFPGAPDPGGDGVDADCNGTDLGELSLVGVPSSVGPRPQSALLFGNTLAASDLDEDGKSELVVGCLEYIEDQSDGLAAVLSGATLDDRAAWEGKDLSVEGSLASILGQTVAVGDLVPPVGQDVVVSSFQAVYVAAGVALPPSLDDAASIIVEDGLMAFSVEMVVGDGSGDGLPDLGLSVSAR